jgi:hypothetical protein
MNLRGISMTENTRMHFEAFIAMNEDGDFEVGSTEEDASERQAENCGGYQCRIVRIGGFMSAPVLIETTVDIPDDAGKVVEIEQGESE